MVYRPMVDTKEFPENVDVALVEGAVGSDEDLHKIKMIRKRTKILVALGDCAVTGNVPAMRNPFRPRRSWTGPTSRTPRCSSSIPTIGVPTLLPTCRPSTRS